MDHPPPALSAGEDELENWIIQHLYPLIQGYYGRQFKFAEEIGAAYKFLRLLDHLDGNPEAVVSVHAALSGESTSAYVHELIQDPNNTIAVLIWHQLRHGAKSDAATNPNPPVQHAQPLNSPLSMRKFGGRLGHPNHSSIGMRRRLRSESIMEASNGKIPQLPHTDIHINSLCHSSSANPMLEVPQGPDTRVGLQQLHQSRSISQIVNIRGAPPTPGPQFGSGFQFPQSAQEGFFPAIQAPPLNHPGHNPLTHPFNHPDSGALTAPHKLDVADWIASLTIKKDQEG